MGLLGSLAWIGWTRSFETSCLKSRHAAQTVQVQLAFTFISFNVEDESHPGSGCKWLRLDTPYIAKLQGLYVERFINVHKFATLRDAKVAQVRWHNLFHLSSLIVAPLHVRLKVVPETPGISQ